MQLSSPYAQDYASPTRSPGWFSRALPGLAFYPQLFGIVWRAAGLAKQGRYDDAAWITSSVETIRLMESLGARVTVENIAAYAGLPGPAVILGNHMSTLETFALPSILRPFRPVTFIIKKQLMDTPVFKHVMRTRQPVVVGRASPREDLKIMLEEGEARLRAGMSVIVFPQKTRAASFTPAEFNSIGVKLAKRAGVPVVPLALRSDAWGLGRMVKDMGPIRPEYPLRFAFGEPITVAGNGREAQEATVAFITTRLRSWGVPVLEAAGPVGAEVV
ncbi:MAG: 1-acyl-sn-glycerol-3-phosphate acyltransferase [Opitutaceae bacterium]|nr:1-acyl-sn-glycerol-3-phosphate acyltransferase [Opitutaceae bacterium]